MAAHRHSPRLTEEWRARIKTGVLLNNLQSYADGKRDMSRGQVAAALGLLKKTLPDLSSTEISGRDGIPLQVSIIKFNDLPEDEKPDER